VPERRAPKVYSIAAHRGFADALVAGLVPRYADPELGLARLTLLLPSGRAVRTMTEAFIRHSGQRDGGSGPPTGSGQGLLMPRMAVVGDLELDEALGPLLDPLGAGAAIPPAVNATRRWLRLAELICEERGADAPKGSALLRLAYEMGRAMDRLLVDDIGPEELVSPRVLDTLGDLSGHWVRGLQLFIKVQDRWLAELMARGEVDPPDRRNKLFRHARRRWREEPPGSPVVAAGITSASPALARLLRTAASLPQGAVVLPDFDLAMPEEVWDELGSAGARDADPPLARGDAISHPQYHLKLLLNRMGVARGEVQPWHRAGLAAAPPERSHAISSLFLPPEASKAWVGLPAEKRRLSGVRLMESANPEEEAQAIALLVREALEEPDKRVAVVTPDRGLAGRVVQHLRRWNIQADDSAGQPLPQTAAGRLFLLLAEVAAEQAAPVPLISLLEHPLVRAGDERAGWLEQVRAFELRLRGPRKEPGLEPLRPLAAKADAAAWWREVEGILAPLLDQGEAPLAERLDHLAASGEVLCGEGLWSREDGRALAAFIEDLRLHAREIGTRVQTDDLPAALREAMDRVAVRPPYGGHPRVAIYGLIEARMTRAELVICGALNEGSWPGVPASDPLLAPAVLRALGVPGADFRIGLAAHDLAGALGAPEVVLSRARRDAAGPAIPSRFWLRVRALLGDDLLPRHLEADAVACARALDDAAPVAPHPRPQPRPSTEQRKVGVSVTALDRLRSDPYQFYASAILRLKELEALDSEPSPAWRGEVAHKVLERWHTERLPLARLAAEELRKMDAHPLMRALWRPRLLKALEWVEGQLASEPDRTPVVVEQSGTMAIRGVELNGKADRIDRLRDGTLAIVDYKTGAPPSGREVEAGYALQLGTLGLMAERGAFEGAEGEPTRFEYWSLGASKTSETGFGYVTTPVLEGRKLKGIPREEFLPQAAYFLNDALDRWILGEEPFTARLNPDAPGYSTYDQLMRLDEWVTELK
jgi:ATP-dependent helicase/nuclease subunit B